MSKDRAAQRQADNGVRRVLDAAQERYRQNRLDEAAAILEEFLSRNPPEPNVLTALAVIEQKRTGLDRSIALLTQALELTPDSCTALSWLSRFLLLAELPERAIAHAERAVQISPRNAAVRVMHGQCLYALGRHDDAIGEFYEALALEPNNPMVLEELGEALLMQQLWSQAVDVLRKSALIARDPDKFLKVAALERRLGRHEQAENHCRRAIRTGLESGESELLLARILTERANLAEAEEHWARALALGVPPDDLNLDRAISLVAIGRFDEALEILERAAEAEPIPGDVVRTLAFARRVGTGDLPLVRRMESALSESGRSPSDRMALLYALGKAHDDLGDYERAIGFFDEANAFRVDTNRIKPFDEAEFEAFVDSAIAFYSGSRFQQSPAARSAPVSPLLVVGMMRSGTTLAEQILTCHPRIGGAGEQGFWADHDGMVVDYAHGRFDPVRLEGCARDYLELLRSLAPDFPLIVDKNPANLQFLGSFHLGFPHAPLIEMRREARDTALSIWMTPTHTTAPFVCRRESIVFAYKQCMRLMDHWRRVIPEDRLLEVQYEDLVSDPTAWVRRMVEHCGVEWDEACLHPERNDRLISTPSVWQVRQPIYRTSSQKWKNYEPWLGAFAELEGLA